MATKKKTATHTYTLAGHPHPGTISQHIYDHFQTIGVGQPIDLKLKPNEIEALEAAGIITRAGEG